MASLSPEKHRPVRSVMLQLFGGVITRALVFLQQAVVTYNFGTSSYGEVFFALSIVPLLVAEYFPATVTQTFIPVVARLSAKNPPQAQRFVASLTGYVILAFVALSAIVFLAPALLLSILAPGLPPEALAPAQQFLRLISISLVFLGVGGVLIGLLQSRGQFAIAVAGQIIYRASVLGGCLIVTSADRFWAMGWVFVFSAIARFFVLFVGVSRHFHVKFTFWPHRELLAMLPRLVPVSIAFLGVQLHLIIDRYWLSSSGTGTITAVTIASTLGLLLSGLIAIPVTTVMLPFLASRAATGAMQEHRRMYQIAFDSILLLLLPCLTVILFYRTEIIKLMYGRGGFDARAIQETSSYIIPYAFGVISLSLYNTVASALYSTENVRLPARAMIVSLIINMAVSPILNRIMGAPGVAWATSVALIGGTFSLLLMAHTQGLLEMNWGNRGKELTRIILATAALFGILFALQYKIGSFPGMNSIHIVMRLSWHSALGFVVYFMALLAIRSPYAINFWNAARRHG